MHAPAPKSPPDLPVETEAAVELVFGYTVMMTDREKTVVDCIDRPDLAAGEGEAAVNAVELLWVKKRIAPHAQGQSN